MEKSISHFQSEKEVIQKNILQIINIFKNKKLLKNNPHNISEIHSCAEEAFANSVNIEQEIQKIKFKLCDKVDKISGFKIGFCKARALKKIICKRVFALEDLKENIQKDRVILFKNWRFLLEDPNVIKILNKDILNNTENKNISPENLKQENENSQKIEALNHLYDTQKHLNETLNILSLTEKQIKQNISKSTGKMLADAAYEEILGDTALISKFLHYSYLGRPIADILEKFEHFVLKFIHNKKTNPNNKKVENILRHIETDFNRKESFLEKFGDKISHNAEINNNTENISEWKRILSDIEDQASSVILLRRVKRLKKVLLDKCEDIKQSIDLKQEQLINGIICKK